MGVVGEVLSLRRVSGLRLLLIDGVRGRVGSCRLRLLWRRGLGVVLLVDDAGRTRMV